MTDEFAAYRRTVGGISFTDVGEGPVTLFVHGVFTIGRLWRNCVQLLADRRRCISVDLPGHGHTPPLGEPSVWGLADAVDTVIRELDLRDIHRVGNDTGGAVAQVVLTRDPQLFTSFALTNCDTEGNFPPPAFRPAVWAPRAVIRTAAKSTPIHFLILIFFNVCFMVVPPVHWLSFPYFLQSLYLPGPYSVNLRYSFIPVAKV